MLTVVAYLLQCGPEIALGLIVIPGILLGRKRAVSKRRWFPLILAITGSIILLASEIDHPIVITSPKSGVIVHSGDSVPITVELHPAFRSALYPSVGVEMPRRWSCIGGPPCGSKVRSRVRLISSPCIFPRQCLLECSSPMPQQA